MFASRLSGLRKTLKLSQYDLAERLGMSRGQLANYEQGQRQPDQETLIKIADYFDVSTDYLLGRTNLKYNFDENHQYKDFEDFLNDPILTDFLKNDLKDLTPEKLKKLKKMYELINNE